MAEFAEFLRNLNPSEVYLMMPNFFDFILLALILYYVIQRSFEMVGHIRRHEGILPALMGTGDAHKKRDRILAGLLALTMALGVVTYTKISLEFLFSTGIFPGIAALACGFWSFGFISKKFKNARLLAVALAIFVAGGVYSAFLYGFSGIAGSEWMFPLVWIIAILAFAGSFAKGAEVPAPSDATRPAEGDTSDILRANEELKRRIAALEAAASGSETSGQTLRQRMKSWLARKTKDLLGKIFLAAQRGPVPPDLVQQMTESIKENSAELDVTLSDLAKQAEKFQNTATLLDRLPLDLSKLTDMNKKLQQDFAKIEDSINQRAGTIPAADADLTAKAKQLQEEATRLNASVTSTNSTFVQATKPVQDLLSRDNADIKSLSEELRNTSARIKGAAVQLKASVDKIKSQGPTAENIREYLTNYQPIEQLITNALFIMEQHHGEEHVLTVLPGFATFTTSFSNSIKAIRTEITTLGKSLKTLDEEIKKKTPTPGPTPDAVRAGIAGFVDLLGRLIPKVEVLESPAMAEVKHKGTLQATVKEIDAGISQLDDLFDRIRVPGRGPDKKKTEWEKLYEGVVRQDSKLRTDVHRLGDNVGKATTDLEVKKALVVFAVNKWSNQLKAQQAALAAQRPA